MDKINTSTDGSKTPKKGVRFTDKQLLTFIIVGAIVCVILAIIIVKMCTATPSVIDDRMNTQAADLVIKHVQHIRCRPVPFIRF